MNKIYRNILLHIIALLGAGTINAQTAWFVDGYHGGVYGHYPDWQAKFMVEKLTEIPDWKICLEIEPETWDTVSVVDADNFKALQEYYSKTGRFGRIEFVNPTYAQPYCYNISGESIIRQFTYGMKKVKKYFPEATFTTYSCEEPCFTSCLPQILKGFGYKFAVIRNPNTCWGGYTSGYGKDLVNWIGPDGTSLLSVPRYECEALSTESTWQTASFGNSKDFIATCFANGIKYPVGMTFQDAGWKHGPWLGNAVKEYYKPSIHITWTDYIEMVKDKVAPSDWVFSQEDIKPGLVWGGQIIQKLAREVRVSENRMVMAEKMAALNFILSGEKYPADELGEGWRTLMLAQHHDCWIVPYNTRLGDNWAVNATRWTNSANRIADDEIAKLFNSTGSSGKNTIRVFNTLGMGRTDVVKVDLQQDVDKTELTVVDRNGNTVPSQILNYEGRNPVLAFEATVPSLGYSTFTIEKGKSRAGKKAVKKLADGKVQIETAYYLAVFDPSQGGEITSLIDRKSGNRQLVEKGKGLNGLRGYFYKEEKFHQSSDSKAKVSVVEEGALFTRIKVENQIAGNHYTQMITFAKRSPRIDFDLTIDWDGHPAIGAYDQSNINARKVREKAFYNDVYKLHLRFPLAEINGKLYKNAPFDVCESLLDNTIYTSWDKIKHNVILNWIDTENKSGDYGIALFSDHTTSYIRTEELPLGLTVQYVGKGLFERYYRVEGATHISYALLPHANNWEMAGIEPASNAWNEPLIGCFVNGGNTQSEFSLMEVTDRNLQVSSVTVEGEALLVRFYNSSKNQNQQVRLNCYAKTLDFVDLNGVTIAPVQTVRDKNGNMVAKLNLPQFGFQTVKLTDVKQENDE
jgi:alpha-mannosidase